MANGISDNEVINNIQLVPFEKKSTSTATPFFEEGLKVHLMVQLKAITLIIQKAWRGLQRQEKHQSSIVFI
ncbi:MAG: hypothetical protein IPN09_15715 [Bacteroidetes bacterium]|nr:hypothetical protein [Bacteroidota bacterium]